MPAILVTILDYVFGGMLALITISLIFSSKYAREKFATMLEGYIRGALDAAAIIITPLTSVVSGFIGGLITAVNDAGPGMLSQLEPQFQALAKGQFERIVDQLIAFGESSPDNAVQMASLGLALAFGQGASSAGVTAAFEAIFPEKLNTLNAAGPIFSQMAGFEEIAKAAREPLYDAAFGQSLKYHFRSLFKPELPDEHDAVLWNSRRLLKDGQLKKVFDASGLKTEFEEAYITSAYRAVSPFVVARGTSTGAIGDDDLRDILKFDGYRDVDIERLIAAFKAVAVDPYRRAALSQFVSAAERGFFSGPAIDDELASFNLPPGADNWVKREIAYRRILQLGALYEKSVSEGYKYQQVSDSEYIPDMENIGLNQADAAARYSIDSIVSRGRAAIAAQRDAARLAKAQQNAELRTLSYQYVTGVIDEIAYTAGIATLGLDPVIAAARIELDTARREAAQVDVFGKIVNRTDAPLLREKVAATEEQVLKKLITPNEGYAALQSYGIPDANARALTAKWEAEAVKIAITP